METEDRAKGDGFLDTQDQKLKPDGSELINKIEQPNIAELNDKYVSYHKCDSLFICMKLICFHSY